MRELGMTWNGTVSENHVSRLPRDVRNIAKEAMKGQRFEYGIGLDYSFSTIAPTYSAEKGGSFVKINDKQALKAASAKAGVPNGEVRVNETPAELGQSKVGPDGLSNLDWGNVPLYTDLIFGVTPVGIHHDGKSNKDEWWSNMWFYPQLRSLVAEALLPMNAASTLRPLARIPIPGGEKQTTRYWMPKSDLRNRMAKVFEPASLDAKSGGSFESIEWEGVCQQSGKRPWHQEIFGDTKGPWQL
jgi:hypothetical protein